MNNLKKLINNLYYLILFMVPVGWFLNYHYYLLRYESEGFQFHTSQVLSIGLVIFASLCFIAAQFFLKHKNKTWSCVTICIYVILALYSINCTTAGQYWDQQKKNQETNILINEKENQHKLIDMYEENIQIAQTEYLELNNIKSASITNMSEQWYYKKTTNMVQDRQSELQAIIKENQNKIEDILSQNKISAKQNQVKQNKQLYSFYADFFQGDKTNNTERVQFIFQILLSILIELIAQVSIYIFIQINESDKIKQMVFAKEEIRQFTKAAFKDIIDNDKKYFLNKDTIIQLMNGIDLDEKKYKHIIKIAMRNKLITREHKKLKPANEFIDRQVFFDTMCKKLEINLDSV